METKVKTFTGDMLTMNDKEYAVKYNDGSIFVLGKLLTRTKFYSPYHEAVSSFNNVFVFEHKPNRSMLPYSEPTWHNTSMFFLKTPDKYCMDVIEGFDGRDEEEGLSHRRQTKKDGKQEKEPDVPDKRLFWNWDCFRKYIVTF